LELFREKEIFITNIERIIRHMYGAARTCMHILGQERIFLFSIGLSQVLALSLFLHAVVMDELKKNDQDGLPIHSACSFLIALLSG